MSLVVNPYSYFTDTNGNALNGYLYVGEVGKNAENYPIAIFYDNLFTTPAPNPLTISAGYIYNSGTIAQIYASADYSIVVKKTDGSLVYSSLNELGMTNGAIGTIDEMKNFVAPYNDYALNVLGYSEAGDGGGGLFYYDASSTEADNGGTIIEPTSGSGRWVRVYDFVKLEYFGVVSPDYVLDSNWTWNSTIDKSTANLGTIIDPSVGLDEQGTGSGLGCMVRQYDSAVNVKWFGAVGDSVADDTASIQNAINVGDIYIPSGDFKISSTINIPSNRRIFGNGYSSKVYTTTGDIDAGINIFVAIEKSNISISNILVQGTGYGLQFPDDGYFNDMGVPILFIGCSNINVSNTFTEKGGGVFNDINQGITNIYLSGCKDAVIANNNVQLIQNGICLDDWYAKLPSKESFYTQNISITGNIVNNGNGRGIVVDLDADRGNGSSISITGNTIRNCATSGIELKGCKNTTCTGNSIFGQAVNRTWSAEPGMPTTYGILVDYNSNDIIVSSNTIKYIRVHGINIVNSGTIKINNNSIELDPSAVSGANCIYYYNPTTLFENIHVDISGNRLVANTTISNNSAIATDIYTSTSTITISVSGNTIQGNSRGVFLNKGKLKISKAVVRDNVFIDIDPSKYKLECVIATNIAELELDGNTASYCNKFLQCFDSDSLGTSVQTLYCSDNRLNTLHSPYIFIGAFISIIIKDSYQGLSSDVIFNTSSASIVSSSVEGMTFFNIDVTKVKNSDHPYRLSLYNAATPSSGTWGYGDRVILSGDPYATGYEGIIYTSIGWRPYGAVVP